MSILLGARGVGKTTCLVQHILRQYPDSLTTKALYIPADHILLGRYSLYGIAEQFEQHGGELLSLDEIHKYRDWSRELKSIADTFPRMKVMVSGSSLLEIQRGSHDLSRRALVEKVPVWSLREFLGLRYGIHLPVLTWDAIISSHQAEADRIVSRLAEAKLKILAVFHEYLACGCYPYFLEYEGKELFYRALGQGVQTTLEVDLPSSVPALTAVSIGKIKRLLAVIAESVPFVPDLGKLKRILEVGDERTLKGYLHLLEEAGLILSVFRKGSGLKGLEKPDKLYLNNPNLMHALSFSRTPEMGNLRETFFLNAVSWGHRVNTAKQGDFLIDGKVTVEIGGRQKSFRQIANLEYSFLVLDDMEIGVANRIPIWLFGFLY